MNDSDQRLRSRVRALAVPPPSAQRKDEALRLALSNLTAIRPLVESRPYPRVVWKVVLTGLTAAVLPAILHLRRDTANPTPAIAANPCELSLEVWNEIGNLFPDRVNAIISNGDQVDLNLSETPVGGSSDQVVEIACQSNRHSCTIVTYSGQEVNIDLNGIPLRITPLIDGNGSVFVLTGDKVIPPNGSPASDAVQIKATTLAKR